MKDEIFTIVRESIEKKFQRDCKAVDVTITRNMMLQRDIGLDSIDLAVLQIEIEDRCNIRFDPIKDDLQKIFCSVDSLCEFLEIRIGGNDEKREK